MKPITDEVILSLMESAERRQRTQAPANDTARPTKPIIELARLEGGGRIISLDFMRRKARAKQTVSGRF